MHDTPCHVCSEAQLVANAIRHGHARTTTPHRRAVAPLLFLGKEAGGDGPSSQMHPFERRCTPVEGVGGDLGSSRVRRFVTLGFDWTFLSQSNPNGFPFRSPRPPVSTAGVSRPSLPPPERARQGKRDPESGRQGGGGLSEKGVRSVRTERAPREGDGAA